MPMLAVQGLVKVYGRRRVVDGVDFTVDRGEIVGLLGPNGAGKTTSFRMTCGMIEPDAGQVVLNDIDVTAWPMYRRVATAGWVTWPRSRAFFASCRSKTTCWVSWKCWESIAKPALGGATSCSNNSTSPDSARRGRCRSRGVNSERLEITHCLVSNPQLILLDEPFTGIDPVTIDSIQEIIRDLRARGISILITDHQVRETLEITDRSYVIRGGQVLCHGTPPEVLANPDARKYYFGEGIDISPAA